MGGKKTFLLICMVVAFLFSLFLSGCADVGDVYDYASKYEATDEQLRALSEGRVMLAYDKGDFESTYDYMRYVAATYISQGSQKIKEHAITIIVTCILLGAGLYYFSGNSTTLKRWAWIIGLGGTVMVFLAVWGSAMLADYFM